MAKSTQKTKTKRQPAKKSRLSTSLRAKKPSVKKAAPAKTRVKKPVKKTAVKKKTVAAVKVRRSKTKKLNIRVTRRLSIVLTFKVSKNKALNRKSKKTKKGVKRDLSFEKNLVLSIVLVGAGVFGSVYAAAMIFGSGFGNDSNVANAQIPFVLSPVKDDNKFLEESVPTHLRIKSVGIDTNVITAGKNPDGTLEVPEDYDIAGWYKYGPTPGEKGPAVIAGHVNRDHGPGVFGALYLVKKGQVIEVKREDGKVALFKVDDIKQFPQNAEFPTQTVYGNIDHAGLRLITCAGDFNYLTRHYNENTVIFASYWKLKKK